MPDVRDPVNDGPTKADGNIVHIHYATDRAPTRAYRADPATAAINIMPTPPKL
jgi:hypothetical protein